MNDNNSIEQAEKATKLDMVIALANSLHREKQGWRYGQSIFNALFVLYPEVANEIRGTKYDCFYDDKKVGSFLTEAGFMLNKEQKVQVSDTTMPNQGDAAK